MFKFYILTINYITLLLCRVWISCCCTTQLFGTLSCTQTTGHSAQIKKNRTEVSRSGSHNCRNLFWIYWFQFHTSPLLMHAVSLCSSPSAHTHGPKLSVFMMENTLSGFFSHVSFYFQSLHTFSFKVLI